MKILMLGWELPPHYTGGMGLVCYQLCKHLSRTGADIEFVLPFTADFPNINFMKINPALPLGVDKVLRDEGGSTYDSQFFTYVAKDGVARGAHMNEHQQNYADYVLKLVLYGDYDIVHAHDWLTLRAGIAAKQATGIPLIAHIHATEFDRAGGKQGNPLIHEIEYIGLHMADRIIAVSEFTKKTIVEHYDIPASKVEVVYNGVDLDLAKEMDGANAYNYLVKMKENGFKVVTNVGRLTMQKGLANLLRAAQQVIFRAPKTLFLIVGTGDQYFELIALAAELGISKNVIFTGFQRGKPWRDAFRIADLFVMPSISEPFGLTPFEALTLGSPVLITKQSGASEILRNCLKVDFWDVNEMANQIYAVVANEALATTLYRNSSAELARLTWEPSVERLLSIYDKQLTGAAV